MVYDSWCVGQAPDTSPSLCYRRRNHAAVPFREVIGAAAARIDAT
jgi:hypothetical protein